MTEGNCEMASNTLTMGDFGRAARELGVDVATIRAVAEVESSGSGFTQDGRPTILYEAHVFHRQTRGRHAGVCDRRGVALSSPRWDRALYGRAGAAQHDRLDDASAFDWDAAHKACSWGLFQILGENHKRAGHETIRSFVDAMHNGGAAAHLDAFVAFIKGDKRLVEALSRHDWREFARLYNGPGYAANQYDTKLARAYRKWA
jgi:hypothetical protein